MCRGAPPRESPERKGGCGARAGSVRHEAGTLRNSAGTTGPSPAFHPSSSAHPPNTLDAAVEEQAPRAWQPPPESLTSHAAQHSFHVTLSLSPPPHPSHKVAFTCLNLVRPTLTNTLYFVPGSSTCTYHTIPFPTRVGDSPFLFEPLSASARTRARSVSASIFPSQPRPSDSRKRTSDRQLKETGIGGAAV